MKYKTAILLIVLLAFSTLSLASAKVRCPTCDGTGEIDCPYCDGTGTIADEGIASCTHCLGTGFLTAKIYIRTMDIAIQGGDVNVTAVFYHKETVTLNVTVTAEISGQRVTSPVTVIPPDEDVTVSLLVTGAGSSGYTTLQIMQKTNVKATADEITCPYCDGSGTVSDTVSCPECGGTGIIECPECEGTGYVEESQLVAQGSSNNSFIIGGAAVGVAVACVGSTFFLLKKRRVSEKSLRNLSNSDLQRWVLKQLDGRMPSSSDSALGIDGFSRLGEPISIKQSDSVDMAAISSFAAALAKNRKRNGIVVAFGFSADAIRGKVRARTSYGIDIQMITFQELMMRR